MGPLYFPALLRFYLHNASHVDPITLDAPIIRPLPAETESTIPVSTKKSHVVINPYGYAIDLDLSDAMPVASEAPAKSNPISLQEFPSRLTIFPLGDNMKSIKSSTVYTRYTAISYTWGRFMVKDTREKDTDMDGCHWKIPANTMFTRQELDLAVFKIGNGNPVWLDVFCIPQDDDDEEKNIEIRKQACIFKGAARAAVWLFEGEDLLQDICSWNFPDYIYETLLPPISHVLVPETKRRLSVLKQLPNKIPWTTSTWTLQESALRSDAIFYDKKGNPVLSQYTRQPLTIKDLMRTMGQLEEDMESMKIFEHLLSEEDLDLLLAARKVVSDVGLGRLNTMSSQELYRAASFRVCERPHDTVYGIMSALGVEMEVKYDCDVEQLRKDFVVALHNNAPAEMQSFLHFDVIDEGKAWRYHQRDSSLSEIHQHRQQTELVASFSRVLESGHLVLDTAIILTTEGITELCVKLERGEGCIGWDDDGQPRSYYGHDSGSWRQQQKRSAQSITNWRGNLVLVPLGRAEETRHLVSNLIYLVTNTSNKPSDLSVGVYLRRVGILVLFKAVASDLPVKGNFFLG
jgi:DNA-binding phage protein